MGNSFKFKQFEVANSRSAQKVGTDGVLLGAWVGFTREDRSALDVGTGTGVIALMLAQRHPELSVTAVDIDTDSVEEASDNFSASPWASRLSAVESDFLKWECSERFDLIVSNPPFFANALKAPDSRRSAARHTDTLPFDLLAGKVAELLSDEGRFAVVLPAEEALSFAGKAFDCGLFLSRVCRVSTREGSPAKRALMEFSHKKGMLLEEKLAIQNESGPTEEYRSLTKDFYLKF